MSEPSKKDRLGEISHLFLSSVRDRQTGGAPRPQRKPPGEKPPHNVTIDLTPEEFAQVFGDPESAAAPESPAQAPPVTAVIGTHLNGKLFDRVKEYAGHLCAASGKRIGLIEVDAAEFRVMLFERSTGAPQARPEDVSAAAPESFDAQRMSDALGELNWDVHRWLLLLPNPRSAEARQVLRLMSHCVLLSTCDHDGVVACYRTLKGLVELNRPRLSLALLDAHDEEQAGKITHKLSSVCQQFLNWQLEAEPIVRRPGNVAEHLVLCARALQASDVRAGIPWQVITSFLAQGKPEKVHTMEPAPGSEPVEKHTVADVIVRERASTRPAEPVERETKVRIGGPDPISPPRRSAEAPTSVNQSGGEDVIELPDHERGAAAILAAIVRNQPARLVECPLKPPMCPEATVAVGTDHRLVLVAIANAGLRDLRAIGRAYQWLMENRALVTMALPQMSIDAQQLPRLQLIVDQADLSADVLQPMLESGNVLVQSYRKLNWAGRTGLLLAA
jgi:hypothetical protein